MKEKNKFEIRKRSKFWNPVTRDVDSEHVCFVESEEEARAVCATNPDYLMKFNQDNSDLANRIANSVGENSGGPY